MKENHKGQILLSGCVLTTPSITRRMEWGYNISTMNFTSIKMTDSQWQIMESHVLASIPREACGVLAGEDGCVHWVKSVTNVEVSQNRFRMDPREQLDVMMRMEHERLQLIGIYHSHPQGPGNLSESDIQEAVYNEAAYLVWSPSIAKWSCRAFMIEHDTAREIPIIVTG